MEGRELEEGKVWLVNISSSGRGRRQYEHIEQIEGHLGTTQVRSPCAISQGGGRESERDL